MLIKKEIAGLYWSRRIQFSSSARHKALYIASAQKYMPTEQKLDIEETLIAA
jgi:hypothetical protein